MKKFRYVEENITELKPNEIFVFGSNANGNHYGGAARIAYEKFGAIWGFGEGWSGNTYAIPTLDHEMERVNAWELVRSFTNFLTFAWKNPSREFLLTKIGCGIAGWRIEEVRDIFRVACKDFSAHYPDCESFWPDNVIIPREFDWVKR